MNPVAHAVGTTLRCVDHKIYITNEEFCFKRKDFFFLFFSFKHTGSVATMNLNK